MKRILVACALLIAACVVVVLIGRNSQEQVIGGQGEAAVASAARTARDEAAIASLNAWDYRSQKDEMVTNGVDRFASIISTNDVDFKFPYQGAQSAILTVRKMAASPSDGKQAPPYDVMISIDRGQLLSGDQGDIEVKLDDAPPVTFQADAPTDNDSTVLFFGDDPQIIPIGKSGNHYTFESVFPLQSFLDKLQHAKTLKVQVTAYQNGSPVFVFNVAGFNLAKLDGQQPANGVPVVSSTASSP